MWNLFVLGITSVCRVWVYYSFLHFQQRYLTSRFFSSSILKLSLLLPKFCRTSSPIQYWWHHWLIPNTFLDYFFCAEAVFFNQSKVLPLKSAEKALSKKLISERMYHVLMIRKTGMKGRNEVESCSSPQKRGLFLSHQSSHPTLALIVVLEVCRNVGACN